MKRHYTGRQDFTRSPVTEKSEVILYDSGFEMNLMEIGLGEVCMKWGDYVNPVEQFVSFHQDRESVVSHFQMHGADMTSDKRGLEEKQFVVYRESVQSNHLCITPTKKSSRSFFELIMSDRFFNDLVSEESRFLKCFESNKRVNHLAVEFMAQISPQMYAVISEMKNAPYSGSLKGLFLEAKMLELFLMQVHQLDNKSTTPVLSGISGADVARLHYIKDYIDLHFYEDLSILALSREAGINQTKLKNGFKALFKTTVFAYITDLRLTEAKRLLLAEKMYVNEVAYQVGFKYPHYFSTAFKKKFGILPATLRC